jgi:hypothetical protein
LQQNAAHLSGAQNGDANVGQLRGYFGGLNGYLRHDSVSLSRMSVMVLLTRILASATCWNLRNLARFQGFLGPKRAKNRR